ncbi:GIY-YIG nuclease family protein [Streptomyces achromogenes]|uniref:GIY-YIG nuclease family protein n=1 Tax=Streptomyces achromogenes TaxID=67255 RepID=UPI003442A819
MPEEVVYVIGSPGINIVKIGRSTDLPKRLGALRRMCPVPLEVLWYTPGGCDLEYGLHGHFASIRSHGEWFRFEDADPVSAIRQVVESGAWKVHLARRSTPAPKKDRTEELARAKAALDEISKLSAEYLDAQEMFEKAREDLHAAIARHLGERNARPSEVVEHTPYDRNHVDRIRKGAGVAPLRRRTVRSVDAD